MSAHFNDLRIGDELLPANHPIDSEAGKLKAGEASVGSSRATVLLLR